MPRARVRTPGDTGRVLVLRPGANGVLRTHVTDVQRARMLAAAVDVVGDLGYPRMSVARVTGRAGVSRRTFYDLFEDREDCFLAVFEEAVRRGGALAGEAYNAQPARWRERVRAGLTALLGFLDDEPGLRALMVVDALAAGPRVLERRARVLDTLKHIVDEGRKETKPGHEPPPLTAEGIVGAVLAVIHARLLSHKNPRLIGLLNPLMGMIVLPYLGQAVATRELEQPKPRALTRRARKPAKDPLEGLDMRLTYRTLRVLTAIAANPSASNRIVAEQAGIADQGQISKLLARLEHLGLAQNTSEGQAKGEPNSWALTPRGREVEHTIHLQNGRGE
jgi:AcrR family transcriptional regulator/DNA-binding MarR family transcriptional regulator